MKGCKKEMKVTLTVHGREMSFTKHELVNILESYFPKLGMVRRPTENIWYEVDPQNIDREIFQHVRADKKQEEARRRILKAFEEIEKNPEKYGKKFETFIPTKDWEGPKTVASLRTMATIKGDHNANWVEAALEWAQRICNGETWENVCNEADTAKYFRMVEWENGYMRLVGGSTANYCDFPATYVYYNNYYSSDGVSNTVPMIVRYVKD